MRGIIFIEYLEKGRTVTQGCYLILLMKLRKKWPQLQSKKKMLLDHDTAPAHISVKAASILNK